MKIWINSEFGTCSKLKPEAKEAFILLVTCYEAFVRATFRCKSIVSELEKLPTNSRLEIYIVSAMDIPDWNQKHRKLSNIRFNHLYDKVRTLLVSDPETNSFLRDVKKAHPSFNIGVILGGEIGRTELTMSEYDRLLVGQQTRELVRTGIKPKQT